MNFACNWLHMMNIVNFNETFLCLIGFIQALCSPEQYVTRSHAETWIFNLVLFVFCLFYFCLWCAVALICASSSPPSPRNDNICVVYTIYVVPWLICGVRAYTVSRFWPCYRFPIHPRVLLHFPYDVSFFHPLWSTHEWCGKSMYVWRVSL